MNALSTPTHTQRLLTIASILLCSHTIGTAGSTDNEKNFSDKTFKEAVDKQDLNTIKEYIKHDPTKYTSMESEHKKNTAIFVAISKKDQDFIKELIQNKANINHQNFSENTPLHQAALNELPLDIIRLLIDPNNNLHIRNKAGHTPLYSAYPNKDIMALLLEHGARTDLKYDDPQQTLLDKAKKDLQKEKDDDDTDQNEVANKEAIVQLLQQTIQDRKNKQNLGTGRSQNRNNNQQNRNSNNNVNLNNNNNNQQNNNINNNTDQKPKDDKKLQKFAGITAVVITVLALLKWITTPPPTPDKHNPTTSTPNQA